jgi:two-component system OmpR family sensor kinase
MTPPADDEPCAPGERAITVALVAGAAGAGGPVETHLSDAGFDVWTAPDADGVLARLGESDVDCVVVDHDPPAVDGLTLLRSVRAAHPDLPFVLCAAGGDGLASRAVEAGATGYLRTDGGDGLGALAHRVRADVEHHRRGQRVQQAASAHELEQFAAALSHDLGNGLTIARGRVEVARESGEAGELDAAAAALDRSVELLDTMTTAVRAGSVVGDVAPTSLRAAFERAWTTQETPAATRQVTTDRDVLADEAALLRLFENLVRNALEHGGDDAAVRLGALPDGFYVEDDGPGIPAEERDQVFDPGYTTKSDGTGIGLVSVRQVARGHGWAVAVTEGVDGGARFEFTGVQSAD